MSEPTTDQVRLDYMYAYPSTPDGREIAAAEFDRWLAAHDAEVRAATLAEQGADAPEGAEVSFFTTLDGDYAEESTTLKQAEFVRREAFGRIPVSERKITKRVTYWVPVEQEGEAG